MYTAKQKHVTAALTALLCLGTIVSCGSEDTASKLPAKTAEITETEVVVTRLNIRLHLRTQNINDKISPFLSSR